MPQGRCSLVFSEAVAESTDIELQRAEGWRGDAASSTPAARRPGACCYRYLLCCGRRFPLPASPRRLTLLWQQDLARRASIRSVVLHRPLPKPPHQRSTPTFSLHPRDLGRRPWTCYACCAVNAPPRARALAAGRLICFRERRERRAAFPSHPHRRL